MAVFELRLPKMGESVAEATIIKWAKKQGDSIKEDDVIAEIATDKVDSEVPSPVTGTLVKTLFKENEVAQVGDVIAVIETGTTADAKPIIEIPKLEPAVTTIENIVTPKHTETVYSPPIAPITNSKRFYSPLVKSIAQKENIPQQELDNIVGTGMEGRVTKDDLLSYINKRSTNYNSSEGVVSPDGFVFDVKSFQNAPTETVSFSSQSDEIIEMDRMRKLIAEHMVQSKKIAPHVTSFVEVDVTNLVLWRDKIKKLFEAREGQKITFTPIFVAVVAKALREYPMVNISIDGTTIIKKKNINIGIATALPSGNLIVPVIHNADQLNLGGIVSKVNYLAEKARQNKLNPDEIQGGTFTISNIGTFGNLLGTPIINQPEVAILAIGAIKKKPAVVTTIYGDVIAVRQMMYLSLSYDHRVVDGFLGGSFLKRIGDLLEAWDMNTEI